MYALNYCKVCPTESKRVGDEVSVRLSKDMVNYGEPFRLWKDGKVFGDHYSAFAAADDKSPASVIEGDEFAVLLNPNGGDMIYYPARIVKR